MQTPGTLSITYTALSAVLEIKIEDNGIGRIKSQEMDKKSGYPSNSLATTLTRERIKAMNRDQKKLITMDIEDLYHPDGFANGTRVVFRIPI